MNLRFFSILQFLIISSVLIGGCSQVVLTQTPEVVSREVQMSSLNQ
jgi:hypothetical protein